MRILRQEGFETLISFLFSQNNNVPRIKGIIERLCCSFGDPIGEGLYGFPSPERLAALSEEELAPLRCGWRGAYVLDAARKVASGTVDLKTAASLPMGEARQALQTIKGVGPKVAECVLLYGIGRLEAFPLDVWMKRAMAAIFPRVYARKLRAPMPAWPSRLFFTTAAATPPQIRENDTRKTPADPARSLPAKGAEKSPREADKILTIPSFTFFPGGV